MPAYNTYKSTMKKNTFLILSLLLLYLYPLSASVEIRSNKLTTGDGLANNSTRYMMQESIEEIWEKEKRTVVFVTNNIEEALYLADRIILLSDCPSQIRAEYKIDLPRPRDLVSPEFMRLRKEITERMNSAVY